MRQVPLIHIFLSSPDDVKDERVIARQIIEDVLYRPLLRGRIAVRIVAWDKQVAGTPLRVNMKPQEAINQELPRPSQCDINIVILWSRMGTEFTDETGKVWHSSTHWELNDALVNAPHNRTIIYRSLIKPKSLENPLSPDYDGNKEQWDRLNWFLKSGLFYKGEQIQRSVTEYQTLDEFRTRLAIDLEQFVADILSARDANPTPPVAVEAPAAEQIIEVNSDLWKGSPFPGLRAFEEADAPIFFGRRRETDELIRRLEANRLIAVIGASGSGKTSLVAAGVIPRLRAGAITSSTTSSAAWRIVRLTPGTNADDGPFAAIFNALRAAFPEHSDAPFSSLKERNDFIESICADPNRLIELGEALLKEVEANQWAEILFFVDQFEELFTIVKEDDRASFVALLAAIQKSQRMRCILTIRSDFYVDCLEVPVLTGLLQDVSYPLAVPNGNALSEMITSPANRAGLTWEEELLPRMLRDMGGQANALPLMAYALEELYKHPNTRNENRLTSEAYTAIGETSGVINKRAENIFQSLDLPNKNLLLQRVFRELMIVDERGIATCRPATVSNFNVPEMVLIDALVEAGLLVITTATVEVIHEIVFRSWTRLNSLITELQEDRILLRRVRASAEEWEHQKRPDYLRWPAERLKPVYEVIGYLRPLLSEVETDFLESEQKRLLREIADNRTNHQRRLWIGERLAAIGDPRSGIGLDEQDLPQIDWVFVDQGGQIDIDGSRYNVEPFYVAKYLITNIQFAAFLRAKDGFEDERWWEGFPAKFIKQSISTPPQLHDNYPRASVSWYQAVAFTRWLDMKYRNYNLFGQFAVGDWQLRLPTEWEWEWMARGDRENRDYAWGSWDAYPRANTVEANIGNRATAVGMYPAGVAKCGALDVSGNVWEWCLNKSTNPSNILVDKTDALRCLRGGAFSHYYNLASNVQRNADRPSSDLIRFGIRVIVAHARSKFLLDGSCSRIVRKAPRFDLYY